jgi:hypothetical protein
VKTLNLTHWVSSDNFHDIFLTRTGHVERIWEKRNAYRIVVGKPEGKNHWEDQDAGGWILEIEWDGIDWIDLAHDTDQ